MAHGRADCSSSGRGASLEGSLAPGSPRSGTRNSPLAQRLAALVYGVFALFKHSVGGKLLGSDVFGRGEYYLGMGSGMLRFGCVLLAVLALLGFLLASVAMAMKLEFNFQWALVLATPRDRNGTFEPQIVAKGSGASKVLTKPLSVCIREV